MGNLARVTKSNPCKACGKDSWCMADDNGDALCMRLTSPHALKMKNGDIGWWHRSGAPRPKYRPEIEPPKVPKINAPSMMVEWRKATERVWIEDMAKALGVSVDSVEAMGAAWSAKHNAWAWPMSNGSGNVCGIRLRYEDGRKIAVTGSESGIFLPWMRPHARAYLVEGPTDTAAMLTLGVYAIGRPSSSGGSLQVKQTIERLKIEEAIIIADNDSDQVTPTGRKFNPGYDGAESLCRMLTIPRKIISLPTKDIREFVQEGGTLELLKQIVDSAVWQ